MSSHWIPRRSHESRSRDLALENAEQAEQGREAGQDQGHGEDHEAQAAKLIGLAKLFSFEVEHGQRGLESMKHRIWQQAHFILSRGSRQTPEGQAGPGPGQAYRHRRMLRPGRRGSCVAVRRVAPVTLPRVSARLDGSGNRPDDLITSAITPHSARLRTRLGRLDFEDEHVSLGQTVERDLVTGSLRRDSGDRLIR